MLLCLEQDHGYGPTLDLVDLVRTSYLSPLSFPLYPPARARQRAYVG